MHTVALCLPPAFLHHTVRAKFIFPQSTDSVLKKKMHQQHLVTNVKEKVPEVRVKGQYYIPGISHTFLGSRTLHKKAPEIDE